MHNHILLTFNIFETYFKGLTSHLEIYMTEVDLLSV